MQSGGGEINKEVARSTRVIGVVITPLIAIYTLLITTGVITSHHLINTPIALAIVSSWALMSFWYFFTRAKKRSDHIIRLVLVHVFSLLSLMFIAGFAQPFAPLYVLLLLSSQIYFGRIGLIFSSIGLIVAGIIDILLFVSLRPEIVGEDILSVLAILVIGFSMATIMTTQESKRKELVHSQLRERLQYDRLLTIINNLTDAAFTTDEKGSIVMYNAACLDLLDTNDSLKGRNIGDLFKLTDKDATALNLFDLLKDATRAIRRDDINHTYSDGESIRLEITFAPIRSNFSLRKQRDELGGYILIMRDVTKQKSLEEERDEFISVVSHELRTPITIVEGTLSNLDFMMKQPKQPTQKILTENVSTAHDQVLYLAKMVNDLSTLSRAERGVADAPEAIDVQDLLHKLHKRYEMDATKNGLHLNLDLGAQLGTVNASRLYLEELLQNFITNAIKYTKEGSVTIIGKRTKNTVRFTVADTGIGISRNDQNKVFNKFYRSEDYRTRETNGTGLGLYVSTKLAHKLHTHIELKSRLNHGSSFSFELPVE